MKKLITLALALILALSLVPSALAAKKIVSPNEDFYYYDGANVLSDETEAFIYFNNVNIQKGCGAQIVVVVVDSLNGMYEGDYAYQIINEWSVGDKKERNGMVILLSIKDDTYFVTVGEGLERLLTPGMIGEINNEYLEPDFARRNYDAGVSKIFRAFAQEIINYYGMNLALVDGKTLMSQYTDFTPQHVAAGSNSNSYVSVEEEHHTLTDIILLLIIIYIFYRLVFRSHYRTHRFIFFPRVPRAPRPPRFGGFMGPRPGAGPRPGSFGGPRPGGFGSSRPSSFGSSSRPSGFGSSSRSSGFGGGRPSSFGGARGGGGGGRGAGAGRGR